MIMPKFFGVPGVIQAAASGENRAQKRKSVHSVCTLIVMVTIELSFIQKIYPLCGGGKEQNDLVAGPFFAQIILYAYMCIYIYIYI